MIVGEEEDTGFCLSILFTMMINERRKIVSSITAPSAHCYEFEDNDEEREKETNQNYC